MVEALPPLVVRIGEKTDRELETCGLAALRRPS